METILRAESLVRKFGTVIAVNDLSFEVFFGEIFGFLGPNGAGKTTTIKMMSGLLKPDSGHVRITNHGKVRSIGLCPQHIVVWENLTCIEQIIFMGQMYNLSRREARRRGEELLESLGLDGVKNRIAKNLSGGMQRRLNIALALIHSPQILFLDEPQAGLDPQSRVLVREYMRSIRDKTTIVLTTHDMEEAEKLSDRICIIDHGKMLASGSSDDLKKAYGNEYIIDIEINGMINEDLLSQLNKEPLKIKDAKNGRIILSVSDPVRSIEYITAVIKKLGLDVKDLRVREKSLEDIFIDLTGRRLRE